MSWIKYDWDSLKWLQNLTFLTRSQPRKALQDFAERYYTLSLFCELLGCLVHLWKALIRIFWWLLVMSVAVIWRYLISITQCHDQWVYKLWGCVLSTSTQSPDQNFFGASSQECSSDLKISNFHSLVPLVVPIGFLVKQMWWALYYAMVQNI